MAEYYYEKVNRLINECEAAYTNAINEKQYDAAREAATKAYQLAARIAEDKGEKDYLRNIYRQKMELWASRLEGLKNAHVSVPVQGADEDDDKAPKFAAETVKSEIRFSDIAGLDDVKALLRNKVIGPINHPEVMGMYKKKPSRTIQVLLYGPPGTGKTMFAEALANELDMSMHRCKASEIIDSRLGQSIRNIKAYMDSIIADESPRILAFVDEFDAIAGKRSKSTDGADGEMNRVVNELLQGIDAMVKANTDRSIVFVATTNRPDSIDSAILRGKRLDTQVYVGLPDQEARRFLVKKSLGGGVPPLASNVNLDTIADFLEGYSSADISTICERIGDRPLFRHYETGVASVVTTEDVNDVIAHSPKSISGEELGEYIKYNEQKGYKTPKTDLIVYQKYLAQRK